jgi:hypothetical protein
MQEQARTPDGEQLLTKKDVARRHQVSERTVNYRMEQGIYPYVKIGRLVRFILRDLKTAEKSHRIGGELSDE